MAAPDHRLRIRPDHAAAAGHLEDELRAGRLRRVDDVDLLRIRLRIVPGDDEHPLDALQRLLHPGAVVDVRHRDVGVRPQHLLRLLGRADHAERILAQSLQLLDGGAAGVSRRADDSDRCHDEFSRSIASVSSVRCAACDQPTLCRSMNLANAASCCLIRIDRALVLQRAIGELARRHVDDHLGLAERLRVNRMHHHAEVILHARAAQQARCSRLDAYRLVLERNLLVAGDPVDGVLQTARDRPVVLRRHDQHAVGGLDRVVQFVDLLREFQSPADRRNYRSGISRTTALP